MTGDGDPRMADDRAFDAYAAGFFDADGCIMIARGGGATNPNWLLQVKVAQVVPHTGVLVLLADRYGGKLIKAGAAKPHHRQAFYWRLHGERAAAFLRAVLPWLTVKRERALLALEFHDICQGTPLTRYHRPGEALRDDCRTRMALLNSKKPGDHKCLS